MAVTVILHIQNTDPVVGELDQMPTPQDSLIIVKHPRKVDGKDLTFLSENVVTVAWPIERLNFLEIVTDEAEDEIIGFVRE